VISSVHQEIEIMANPNKAGRQEWDQRKWTLVVENTSPSSYAEWGAVYDELKAKYPAPRFSVRKKTSGNGFKGRKFAVRVYDRGE
jgi:hypothetical protein